jgi:phage gpG-like protein
MMRLEGSTNSQNVEKALEAFQASLGDFSGALASIAEDFRRMVAEQFATQGESGGTPWAGLAPSTRRRKKRGGSILNDTGALLQSLVDPDEPGHVEAADNLSLEIGTDLPYAMFHQTGAGWGTGLSSLPPAPRHGRGVPMRPILVLTSDYQDRWVGFVLQEIESEARALGLTQLGGDARLNMKFEG